MIRGARDIPRVKQLSRSAFRDEYELPRRPVVVTDALAGRRALSRWSLAYLATQSDLPVRVRVSARGAQQLFDGDQYAKFEFRNVPLRDAIAGIDSRGEIWYVQHVELAQLPELEAELGNVACLPSSTRSHALLWVCGPGTVNPLHWDTNHVALAQIVGEKRFVIFPPTDSTKLASRVHCTLYRTTALDLLDIDHARFPELDRASPWTCTVRPGEVLFIPYRWWHFMECSEPCVSVSWWWSPSFAHDIRDRARDGALRVVQRMLRAIGASGRRRPGRRASPQSPRAD